MSHALIIDDNLIVSRVIQDSLEPLGFRTFDYAWTEIEAVAAAAKHPPDLLVIGDSIEEGSAIDAARHISADRSMPVLMVTADRCRAERQLPSDGLLSGPFHISELQDALTSARVAS